MGLNETIFEITKEIPLWVPYCGIGLIFTGIVIQGAVRAYKGTKRLNAHFQELQESYRSDFSKEELIPFFKDLVKNVKPNLIGKKREFADKMSKNLEEQIMAYATQEVQEAIVNGAVLGFKDPIEPYSPTYKKAINLFRSSKE